MYTVSCPLCHGDPFPFCGPVRSCAVLCGAGQAWTTGPTQAELAMMVLARLIEDCHDVDFRSEVGVFWRGAGAEAGARGVGCMPSMNAFSPS